MTLTIQGHSRCRPEPWSLLAAILAIATYRNLSVLDLWILEMKVEQIVEPETSPLYVLGSDHDGAGRKDQLQLDHLSTTHNATDNNNAEVNLLSDATGWKNAILATTRLLYRDSPPVIREFWLSQPPPKVYIYDTIPASFSDVAVISECVDRNFLGQNISDIWVAKKKNCRWRPTVCDDHTVAKKTKASNVRLLSLQLQHGCCFYRQISQISTSDRKSIRS